MSAAGCFYYLEKLGLKFYDFVSFNQGVGLAIIKVGFL